MTPTYTVRCVKALPEADAAWDNAAWAAADPLEVALFHPESSAHRPVTWARMLHDGKALAGIFHVSDRYVLCRQTGYQAMVCKDSCVEFFVRPKPDKGYMNFEMNCCGHLRTEYIEDPTRVDGGFKKSMLVAEKFGKMVRVHASLSGPIEKEMAEPVVWTVGFHIPFGVFEAHMGALGDVHGQVWRANFYKCADDSSHPHWASWSPVGEQLNFHQPDRFGLLVME